MPYCPECKYEYREGYTRCTECGRVLEPGDIPKELLYSEKEDVSQVNENKPITEAKIPPTPSFPRTGLDTRERYFRTRAVFLLLIATLSVYYLLVQADALRTAIVFIRRENGFIAKASEFLAGISNKRIPLLFLVLTVIIYILLISGSVTKRSLTLALLVGYLSVVMTSSFTIAAYVLAPFSEDSRVLLQTAPDIAQYILLFAYSLLYLGLSVVLVIIVKRISARSEETSDRRLAYEAED